MQGDLVLNSGTQAKVSLNKTHVIWKEGEQTRKFEKEVK